MEKVTEIIKTETSTRFNHIRVLTQEYLIENGKKQPLGLKKSQVINCGDTKKLKSLGLDKKYPASEWWPKALIEEFQNIS